MVDFTITLTDNEYKGLSYIAVDPHAWILNLAQARAAAAIQEIYNAEITRMMNDPNITSIPANMDAVVANAVIVTAAQAQAAMIASGPPGMIQVTANT